MKSLPPEILIPSLEQKHGQTSSPHGLPPPTPGRPGEGGSSQLQFSTSFREDLTSKLPAASTYMGLGTGGWAPKA